MSGGALQRLGLARAILVGARVIVLDDATRSLDTATEVKVAQAFDWALVGRTSLVVAHRRSPAFARSISSPHPDRACSLAGSPGRCP